MKETGTRRKWLTLCGFGAATALAGCVDNGDDSAGESPADAETDDSDPAETDDGGADAGTDDTAADDSGAGDGETDDGSSGDTETDDGETDDGSEDGDSTESTEPVRFGNTLNWHPLHVIEMEFEGDHGRTGSATKSVHEGDYYYQIIMDGEELEWYQIDSTVYVVQDGRCTTYDQNTPELQAEDMMGSVDDEPEGDEFPDLEPSETTVLDGEEVYVFEMPGDSVWYVSTATGYPFRLETSEVTANFHSWGDTTPISPPETDCMSFEDF